MIENPYAPQTEGTSVNARRQLGFVRSVVFAVCVPFIAAFAVYLPFRLIASQVNTVTWGDSDDFYYTIAIATWPIYMAVLATTICALACRAKMRVGWHVILIVLTAIAVFNTSAVDDRLGWHDSGRDGLDRYSANFDGMSTPNLSTYLVLPSFLVCWVGTLVVSFLLSGERTSAVPESSNQDTTEP